MRRREKSRTKRVPFTIILNPLCPACRCLFGWRTSCSEIRWGWDAGSYLSPVFSTALAFQQERRPEKAKSLMLREREKEIGLNLLTPSSVGTWTPYQPKSNKDGGCRDKGIRGMIRPFPNRNKSAPTITSTWGSRAKATLVSSDSPT